MLAVLQHYASRAPVYPRCALILLLMCARVPGPPLHACAPTQSRKRCLSRTFLYIQSIVFVLAKARAKKRVHEIASFTVFFCWNAYLCSHLQVCGRLLFHTLSGTSVITGYHR